MKKYKKQILIGLLLIFIGFFIHPRKVIYEPKISGKVTDETGNPVVNATVARIENRYFKNKEFGYEESEEFRSQTVRTDINGNFVLIQQSRIEWIHNLLFMLPVVYCSSQFEVSKEGFKTLRTTPDEYEVYNENLNFCKGIVFKPQITLKKR